MSTIGTMYKQPRVFAHDAHAVVVGAINYSAPPIRPGHTGFGDDGTIKSGIAVTNFGAGHAVGDILTLGLGSGVATVAAQVTVRAVNAGVITDWEVTNSTATPLATPYGRGYQFGDTVVQTASTGAGINFGCTILNIDIPGSHNMGVCLYFSGAAAANVEVLMESAVYGQVLKDGVPIATPGTGYSTNAVVTIPLVPVGSFMPVLVKQVLTHPAAAGDILALY